MKIRHAKTVRAANPDLCVGCDFDDLLLNLFPFFGRFGKAGGDNHAGANFLAGALLQHRQDEIPRNGDDESVHGFRECR